jgi:hypothetical protein
MTVIESTRLPSWTLNSNLAPWWHGGGFSRQRPRRSVMGPRCPVDSRARARRHMTTAGAGAVGLTGGCQCGAPRYRLDTEPSGSICHCRMCQKVSDGPFMAFGGALRHIMTSSLGPTSSARPRPRRLAPESPALTLLAVVAPLRPASAATASSPSLQEAAESPPLRLRTGYTVSSPHASQRRQRLETTTAPPLSP